MLKARAITRYFNIYHKVGGVNAEILLVRF